MTQDQTQASYDAVAAAYAEQVREVGRGQSRVWDVGCGPGHVTAFLAGQRVVPLFRPRLAQRRT
jgi:trans-aconitate methyltransferase